MTPAGNTLMLITGSIFLSLFFLAVGVVSFLNYHKEQQKALEKIKGGGSHQRITRIGL